MSVVAFIIDVIFRHALTYLTTPELLYPPFLGLQGNGQPQPYPGFDQMVGATSDPKPGTYSPYPSLNSVVASNWPAPIAFPPQAATPTLLGKG